ncbi:hypothetical protein V2658_14570 [Tenacibaculum maritimum]
MNANNSIGIKMENTMLLLQHPLPEWHIEPIFNTEVPTVKAYKGKPLLILFFNLGCPGCKGRALPYANRTVVENGTQLNVIGIHSRFEEPEYSFSDFKEAQEKYYIRFPFYKDSDILKTFKKHHAGGTPHWLLINSEGALEYSIFGSDPNNALLRLDLKIKELIS